MSETSEAPEPFEQGGLRPADLDRLQVFIGRWINSGRTVGEVPIEILTSDVYEWMPGSHFVLHNAYGTIGDLAVGGTEILGWDSQAGNYFSIFYDSSGGVHRATVKSDEERWTWSGATTGCTAEFSPDGLVQMAHHVRLDADRWVPSMEVVLRKIV
jgi:hypothetical protein